MPCDDAGHLSIYHCVSSDSPVTVSQQSMHGLTTVLVRAKCIFSYICHLLTGHYGCGCQMDQLIALEGAGWSKWLLTIYVFMFIVHFEKYLLLR